MNDEMNRFGQGDRLVNQLMSTATSIADDIEDYIEEHPSNDVGNSIDDIDKVLSKMEELRSAFRGKHNELKVQCGPHRYPPNLEGSRETTLARIKSYLTEVRARRKLLRDGEETAKTTSMVAKREKLKFMIAEVIRTTTGLQNVFNADLDDLLDEEITSRKTNLADQVKVIQTIPKSIQEIIDAGGSEAEVTDIKDRYETLIHSNAIYVVDLDEQISEREIHKQKKFNASTLNIKIAKFGGYSATQDIYTFQDDFEKVHLKLTPKSLLPDLLKNNYLEGSALSLVKDVNDIDDMWIRLKEAYGDSKLMLSKKMSQFTDMEHIGRTKDNTKTIDTISKIVNLMKDLMQLSKRHNIENNLYYGDGLEKIYRLMGDGRINRWLGQKDEKKEGEDLWLQLISFLEKELKVHQQKALIFPSSQGKEKDKDKDKDRKNKPRDNNYYQNDSNSDSNSNSSIQFTPTSMNLCAICGEQGHVQTLGPKGMKLVQYFVCKKWTEMKNSERLEILKQKGLCFQCLFPGAEISRGKHATGQCQRDFVCPHQSHDRFTTKKHVLVCEEHKDNQENKELLDKFKSRCILKRNQVNLPSYAKEIGFVHYVGPSMFQAGEPEDVEENVKLQALHSATEDQQSSSHVSSNSSESECSDHTHHNNMTSHYNHPHEFIDSVQDESVFMLQTIEILNEAYNIFYDSGCGGFLSRYAAVLRLRRSAIQLVRGNFEMKGVGDSRANAGFGIFGVDLPLADGGYASLQGGCMEVITERFPQYPMKGEIEEDIRKAYAVAAENDVKKLPQLPESIGGDTDFMMGSRYRKFFPMEIFRLPSGLSICKSMFKNPDGTRGVICGPHPLITRIDRQYGHHTRTFLESQRKLYLSGYQVNPDVSLLGYKDEICIAEEMSDMPGMNCKCYHAPRAYRRFEAAEMAGSQITFRCPDCRICCNCKNHEHIEAVSIKEEVEQDLINKSIHIDVEKCETSASLPLLGDPAVKLAPNAHKALKTYQQQVKILSRNPEDKQAAIDSERKLEQLGYVTWVKNLPPEMQKELREHEIQNFYPWRICFKENSPTTPARLVFDGSQATDSGFSINDLVPKGINMLNKLVEMFILWRTFGKAFHCDVQKMYNAIKLLPEYWCLQRYWFQEELDPNIPPEEKIIMTVIYGIRSSGNQAQCALRQLAEMFKDQYPEVHEIIARQTYMDDVMGGAHTTADSETKQDNLECVLRMGGFKLKGFTVSGEDPDKSLASKNGISISVAGMLWFSREDLIGLDIKELNFAKKRRGKKPIVVKEIPKNLTKRHCASKLGEIFDLTGIVTPLIAGMKMDLHELNVRKPDWDDVLPNELQAIWHTHFEMIQEMKDLRYERAVIPSDAVDLNATTLDFGDASKSLVCVAIYIRFKRKNGEYSCQLIFSRSRIVPDGMTQPRAELYAALVNTHSGEVVRRALGDYHQHALKFTDSQIVLYWIAKNDQILKEWARNRVIEIHRFTEVLQWYYVYSEDMIADIGTRRCTTTSVVDPDSVWIQGHEWMRGKESDFPMMTAEEVTLNNQELQSIRKEVRVDPFKMTYAATDVKEAAKPDNGDTNVEETAKSVNEDTNEEETAKPVKPVNENLLKRYKFSKYAYDPNRHRYTESVRIIALLFRFITKSRHQVKVRTPFDERVYQPVNGLVITDEELNVAKMYLFKKATSEVKHFLKLSRYEDLSNEVDGVLTYTGRILPTDDVTIVGRATQVMKDLTSTMFCVPLVEKNSPLAFSIASDVHWNHPTAKHCGVETVWRYVLQHAYIIEGKPLVTKIGKSCERCRYLNKKSFEIAMGPVSPHNLNIAPAFYVTQTDLAGPFSAHCHHHKT